MTKPELPKKSGISEVISPDQEVFGYFEKLFREPKVDGLVELVKTPEVTELIEEINRFFRDFLAEYGVSALNLEPKHFHFLNRTKLSLEIQKSVKDAEGMYLPSIQVVLFFLDFLPPSQLHLAQIISHETVHFNAFNSYAVKTGEKNKFFQSDIMIGKGEDDTSTILRARRLGLRIFSPQNEDIYLRNWDEAVATELSKRFIQKYGSRIKILQPELEQSHPTYFPYFKERHQLDKLIDDLYQKNKTHFTSQEDVFGLFAKAMLTNSLSPLVQLIEKTYGPGAFKKWAREEAEDRK